MSHDPEGLKEEVETYEAEDAQERGAEMKELKEVREGGDGTLAAAAATRTPSNASRAPPSGDDSTTSKTDHSDDTHVDVEKAVARNESPSPASEEEKSKKPDPNVVTWDSPDSQENPRNWSNGRKWAITTLISLFTFFSPLSSSMIAPALPIISTDFGITDTVQQNLMLSIFVLAYAIGPLLLGPLSEMFGRRPIIQGTNVVFICFTIGCAVSQNQTQLTVLRFCSGLAGSAPLVSGGGTIADLFTPEQRGKAMAMYSLAPLLGPVIGPIVGGAIVEYWSGQWRWIFGIAAIASAVPAVLAIWFLQETYAPRVLSLKAARLRKETGNAALHTVFELQDDGWQARFRHNAVRPFVLLGTQPIVQLLAAYMSLIYGVMYLLLTAFDSIFVGQYSENTFIASLNYISLGLGFTFGGQIGGRLVDRIYKRLKDRNNGKGLPEHKLPLMMVSCFLVPIGLIIFGFSAQHRVFWLVPNIGAFIFGLGMMGSFLCLQSYTIDSYTLYAASALASVGFCRSLFGFGLPLAAPSLFNQLGYDYGCLLLAALAAFFGIPAAFGFYYFGAKLRAKSPYAASGTVN